MKKTSKSRKAKKHNPDILKGSTLNYNAAIRQRYAKALVALVKQMTEQTKRQLLKEFKKPDAKEYFAQDESISSQSRILVSALRSKFEQLFNAKAKGLAESMIEQTEKASSGAVELSLKQMSAGLTLGKRTLSAEMKEVIKSSIVENVSLIKSIPSEYFTQIEGAVMRSIAGGNGLQDLVPFLNNYQSVTIRRARFIADDQSRKAYANLSAAKMKSTGIKKYEWVHSSAAQEPRPLHLQLNGSIQSLDDPPIIQYAKGKQPQVRGKPGDLINCTCIMKPVLEFSE